MWNHKLCHWQLLMGVCHQCQTVVGKPISSVFRKLNPSYRVYKVRVYDNGIIILEWNCYNVPPKTVQLSIMHIYSKCSCNIIVSHQTSTFIFIQQIQIHASTRMFIALLVSMKILSHRIELSYVSNEKKAKISVFLTTKLTWKWSFCCEYLSTIRNNIRDVITMEWNA